MSQNCIFLTDFIAFSYYSMKFLVKNWLIFKIFAYFYQNLPVFCLKSYFQWKIVRFLTNFYYFFNNIYYFYSNFSIIFNKNVIFYKKIDNFY